MNQRLYIFFLVFSISLLAACSNSKETATRKVTAEQKDIQLPDSLSQKQAAGIDFFAEGYQPVAWTLEMDVDKGYYFKTSNGIYFETPAVKAVRKEDIAASSYAYSSRQGEMSILVYDAACSSQGKKVELTVNGTRYTGCGKDLYNNAVNDLWILEKNGNTVLQAKDFPKGLPRLSFSLAENKMTGSDGCNSITAPIQMMGSRIRFFDISGSAGNCKNTSIQKLFMEKLNNQLADYYFKNGKLYLYLIDDSILEFRKGS